MKNLTWQNPEQLFVAQELINKVKSKCCGIKEKKKIVVEIIEKPHSVTDFTFQPSQYKEYSIKELKDAFSVEEWRI